MRISVCAATIVVLAAALAACGPSDNEKKVIEDLTSNMQAVCVGRLMLEVPHDAKIDGRVKLFYGVDINTKTVDVSIESLDSTIAAMRTMVDAEAKKIDKGDKNWKTKGSMLIDYREINDHTIYLRQYGSLASSAGSKHDVYVLIGKTQLVLSANSAEGVPEAGRYEPDGKVETPEQVASRLFRIAGAIRAVDASKKVGSGYCLGPVVIDSDHDEERGNAYMTIDRYPDLLVEFFSEGLTPDQPDQQLANRSQIANDYSAIHVLRNRDITLGGMKAHEWLARMTDHDHDDIEMLSFAAESIRPNPALIRPYLNITFGAGGQLTRGPDADIGKYVSSSLTPKEATALWDAMIQSIRVRPDAIKSVANSKETSP